MDKKLVRAEMLFEVKAVDDKEKTIHVVGSKEVVDRQGDIVLIDGIDLKNYKKYSPILWGHDWEGKNLPIGRSVRTWKEDGQLNFKVDFPTEGTYPLSDTIYKMIKGGYIKASSIGFLPKKWNYPEEADKSNRKDKPHRIFEEVELLELSFVPLPANPDALVAEGKSIYRKAIDDGVITEEELQEMIKPEKQEIDKSEMVIKPYPNEHSCRIKQPGQFDSFARKNCYKKHNGKCIDFIFGIKEGKAEIQALRFDKDVWTAAAAKSVCSDFGGSFEAAKSIELIDDYLEKTQLPENLRSESEVEQINDKPTYYDLLLGGTQDVKSDGDSKAKKQDAIVELLVKALKEIK